MNDKTLKAVQKTIRSKGYDEIEKIFKEEAEKLKNKSIDREKPYIDQGAESHANELASDAIESALRTIKDIVKEKPKPKNWG